MYPWLLSTYASFTGTIGWTVSDDDPNLLRMPKVYISHLTFSSDVTVTLHGTATFDSCRFETFGTINSFANKHERHPDFLLRGNKESYAAQHRITLVSCHSLGLKVKFESNVRSLLIQKSILRGKVLIYNLRRYDSMTDAFLPTPSSVKVRIDDVDIEQAIFFINFPSEVVSQKSI